MTCLSRHCQRFRVCTAWGVALVSTALVTGFVAASVPKDEQANASGATMVLVIGAPGDEEYRRSFDTWADRWLQAAEAADTPVTLIGRDDEESETDRERLQAVLTREQKRSHGELWLVLIGHGTFDGRQANFNLRGADISASELATWLDGGQRPLAIINCASASAPFIDRLAGPERVIVTATKSGSEENYARFGDYLSQAIDDHSADLDKDGQVSLLEAFLRASRQTQAYYDGLGQLATEHALLDDNADARGSRADFFSGLRAARETDTGEALDGLRAHQWHLIPSDEERRLPPNVRQRRNELELQLAALRERKAAMEEDAYYQQLEPLLVEIARLYDSIPDVEESTQPQTPPDSPPAK